MHTIRGRRLLPTFLDAMAEEQVVLEGFLEKKGEKGVIKVRKLSTFPFFFVLSRTSCFSDCILNQGYKKREFKLFKTGQLRYYDKDQEMGFILMDTVKVSLQLAGCGRTIEEFHRALNPSMKKEKEETLPSKSHLVPTIYEPPTTTK